MENSIEMKKEKKKNVLIAIKIMVNDNLCSNQTIVHCNFVMKITIMLRDYNLLTRI